MQTGQPSKTALGVAIRRAAHQLVDRPPVLDDPIAVRLVGSGYPRHMERAMHTVGRDLRSIVAARSRYAEDHLAAAAASGVSQYAVLGAGLDTFAYRNPFAALRVFEVDFPATQAWKHAMLAQAGIEVPGSVVASAVPGVVYVPLDLEHHTLSESLAEAGMDLARPAFFSWLGVIPYLTLAACRATFEAIAALPLGSGVSFDYALEPTTLNPLGRKAFNALAERVAAAGEPFQLFFTPESLQAELRRAGFRNVEQLDYGQINERYFRDRADGLKLSPINVGMLATAWV
jgi:methyltransferase (TIGR00027 family)